jgi:PPE-repeat protein
MKKLAAILMTASALALLAPVAAVAGNGKGNNGNGNGNGGSNSGSNGNGNSGSGNSGSGNSGSGNSGSGNSGSGNSGSGNSGSGNSGSGSSNSGNSNSGGNGGTVALLDGPCVLVVGGYCDFSGNINLNNKLADIDTVYDSQTPAPPTLLDLHSLNQGEQDGGFSNPDAGTITSTFLVTYYAVKAGDEFRLFEIAPTYTFSWTTAGMTNNGGQQPDVSHVIWIDPPSTVAVPEPATWALMILGFGGAGAMLRQRRRLARAAA